MSTQPSGNSPIEPNPRNPKPAVRSSLRMLRVRQAAELLAVSDWKVRQLCKDGELPYMQNGIGPLTIDLRDLEGYIERNKRLG